VVLWVYYQHFPNLPIELPEPQPGVKKNDYLFPIFILTQIPSGMKGFLVVGILCAAMSSVSSALSALSSVSTIDLFKSLTRGKKSEATYLRVSKLSTIAWGAVLVLVAWWTQKTTSVLNTAFALSGLTTGALLGGLLLSLLWKTGSAVPVICGMIGSFGVMLGIKINGVIPWPWYTLIGSSIVFIVAFGVRFAMNLTSKSEVT
jgi:SSS family solute:Na+ symporter